MKKEDWKNMQLEKDTQKLIKKIDDIFIQVGPDLEEAASFIGTQLHPIPEILRKIEHSIRNAQRKYYELGYENGKAGRGR